jgi:hypothetical protein
MALEGISEHELSRLKEDLISLLRSKGGTAGNTTLIKELKWDEDQYWNIRDLLVDSGLLQLGKGKGGSVRLIESIDDTMPPAETSSSLNTTSAIQSSEADLYEPMATCLRNKWVKDNRYRDYIVEITAKQGRRDTGGRWSRPDITIVGLSVFTYLPGRFLDVSTFEVKPADSIDITCVYEALAHRRGSTRAYVLLHVPDNMDSIINEICAEAKRHGVGVITAKEPENYETWEELVEAQRVEPSPERLNDFIAQQISEGAKQDILQWFK